jgi:hypothetical protein
MHRAFNALNATAFVGGVQTNDWSADFNQEWSFSRQGNKTFRIVPRTAWWRSIIVYNRSSINIMDHTTGQNWILTNYT